MFEVDIVPTGIPPTQKERNGSVADGRIVIERVTVRTIDEEECPVAVGSKGVSWKGSAIVMMALASDFV